MMRNKISGNCNGKGTTTICSSDDNDEKRTATTCSTAVNDAAEAAAAAEAALENALGTYEHDQVPQHGREAYIPDLGTLRG